MWIGLASSAPFWRRRAELAVMFVAGATLALVSAATAIVLIARVETVTGPEAIVTEWPALDELLVALVYEHLAESRAAVGCMRSR